MAGSHTGSDPREVRAEAVIDRAQSGDLVKIGDFTLRDRDDEQLISIHNLLVENSEAIPGEHELPVYASFADGFAVIDLDGGLGGDGHGE